MIGAKTGPLAPGAAITHFPPFKLWAHEVNARGGLKLKDGQRKIEIIEYDDRTQPPEAIKAVERCRDGGQGRLDRRRVRHRLQSRHRADVRQVQLSAAHRSLRHRSGAGAGQEVSRFLHVQSSTTNYAKGAIGVLKKLKDGGQIGNKVAVVNVGDDFGIELANAGRPLFKEAGFEIVYDKSYPLGTQDYTPVIKAAKAANPDAFVAWSYPPDTFGLADAAKIEGLAVKAYYCAVGCAFQGFSQKNGAAAENVLGAGGVADSPEIRDFYKRHKEVTGVDADYWGSPIYYSMLQMLTQSIEAVGSMDRMAIADHIRKNKFKTLIGEIESAGPDPRQGLYGRPVAGRFLRAVAGVNVIGLARVKLKTNWG